MFINCASLNICYGSYGDTSVFHVCPLHWEEMLLSCKLVFDGLVVCHVQSTLDPVTCKLASLKFARGFCNFKCVWSVCWLAYLPPSWFLGLGVWHFTGTLKVVALDWVSAIGIECGPLMIGRGTRVIESFVLCIASWHLWIQIVFWSARRNQGFSVHGGIGGKLYHFPVDRRSMQRGYFAINRVEFSSFMLVRV